MLAYRVPGAISQRHFAYSEARGVGQRGGRARRQVGRLGKWGVRVARPDAGEWRATGKRREWGSWGRGEASVRKGQAKRGKWTDG